MAERLEVGRHRRMQGLPFIEGRVRAPFLAIWWLALAASLLSIVIAMPHVLARSALHYPRTSAFGFIPARDGTPTVVTTDAEAAREGLAFGDLIVAVDGERVSTGSDAAARLASASGRLVMVDIRSHSGLVARRVLTRDPQRWRRALAAVGLSPMLVQQIVAWFPLFFGSLLPVGCAVILMARRSHDRLSPWASITFLLVALGSGSAGFDFSDWLGGTWFYLVTNAVSFSLLVTVLAVFPTGRFEPRWSVAVVVLGAIAGPVTAPMSQITSNAALVLIQCAAMAVVIDRYRCMPPDAGRQQIRWALFGFAASLIALAALSVLQLAGSQATTFGELAWTVLASAIANALSFAVLLVAITVALLRWRLYDADATISRSVVYATLSLSLLGVFAGTEKLIEITGEEWFGARLGALAGGLGAALAAVCIGPLHHRVTHWAEKRFRGGLVRLRAGLPVLVADLRETRGPAALADAVLERIERGIRARCGAVVVGGRVLRAQGLAPDDAAAWLAEHPLDADTLPHDRADELFPLRQPLRADGPGLVGWLLLGPRPDSTQPGRDERDAVRDVAEPIARALAVAIEREKRETEQQARDEWQDNRFEALREAFDSLRERFQTLHGIVEQIAGRGEPAGLAVRSN